MLTLRLCCECQQVQSSPAVAPLSPWKWPSRPWARVHVDFAGPILGKNILITVDAHSKWIEAVCTPSTSSNSVIEELCTAFTKFGLPEMIVTDNGTGFVSEEFESFLRSNGIKHTASAQYHPASNGPAERAVQMFKRGLGIHEHTSSQSPILVSHHSTGVSPAELLIGRWPHTRLDLLHPNTA